MVAVAPSIPGVFWGADVWGDLGNVATICDVPGAKEPQRAGSSQRVLWGCSRRQLQGVFRTGTEPGGGLPKAATSCWGAGGAAGRALARGTAPCSVSGELWLRATL